MPSLRTRRRPGRPTKAETEKRKPRFGVWVNSAEAAEIRRKAAAVGLPPAVYLRRVALGKPIRPRPPIPAVNRDLYLEVGRFAGALNQLMRAWHRDARTGSIPLPILEDGLALVRQVRAQLMGAEE